MRALDLFCGGGGVAEGLIAAGFAVTGIDTERRCGDCYPGTFVLSDATRLPVRLDDFDFVWASPPCQRFSRGTPSRMKADHPDMIAAVRHLIAEHPLTCIENVVGAPIRKDLILTGPMVGLPRIIRKRYFELSFELAFRLPQGVVIGGNQPDWISGKLRSINRSGCNPHFLKSSYGVTHRTGADEAREIMGIANRKMPLTRVGEAVPPAYARLIGSVAAELIAGRSA